MEHQSLPPGQQLYFDPRSIRTIAVGTKIVSRYGFLFLLLFLSHISVHLPDSVTVSVSLGLSGSLWVSLVSLSISTLSVRVSVSLCVSVSLFSFTLSQSQPTLRILNICGNGIESLEDLAPLQSLTLLDVAHNAISDLSVRLPAPSVRGLALTAQDVMGMVAHNPFLSSLSVAGNPLCAVNKHREEARYPACLAICSELQPIVCRDLSDGADHSDGA